MDINEKTKLLRARFISRDDVFYFRENAERNGYKKETPVDDNDTCIANHIEGTYHIGSYNIFNSTQVKCAVLDFDINDESKMNEVKDCLLQFRKRCKDQYSIKFHIEISKSRGFHLWIFFDRPVDAGTIRKILHYLVESFCWEDVSPFVSSMINLETFPEIFPKSDSVEAGSFGSCSLLPLHGESVKNQKTVFIDESGEISLDQWAYLATAEITAPETLETLMERIPIVNQESEKADTPINDSNYPASNSSSIYDRHSSEKIIEALLDMGSFDYRKTKKDGKTLYHFRECPVHKGNKDHKHECCVIVHANGSYGASCKHNPEYRWKSHFKEAIGWEKNIHIVKALLSPRSTSKAKSPKLPTIIYSKEDPINSFFDQIMPILKQSKQFFTMEGKPVFINKDKFEYLDSKNIAGVFSSFFEILNF